MKIKRTEIHFIKINSANWKKFDDLCFRSKNLFNYVNYLIRQSIFNKEKIPSKYDMVKILCHENQHDYRSLPAQCSQQIIYNLYESWNSFFKLIKKKIQKKVGLIRYKLKKKGRNVVIFTNQQCKIVDGKLIFPKTLEIIPINTKAESLREVRITPISNTYKLEIVYEKEIKKCDNLDNKKFIGIDLGINNLVAIASNVSGQRPVIINGRPLKSINQYFNKKLAKLKSELILKHNKLNSKRIEKLYLKRNLKIKDYIHKVTRRIISYCKENIIGNIVIGYNKNWKTSVNLGKRCNQKFVQIPFLMLINQLKYKAEELGITVILTEESYTSKTDNLIRESFGTSRKNNRIKRGLFSSSKGIINSDINGAIGILRKVIGDGFSTLLNTGFVLNPLKSTIS